MNNAPRDPAQATLPQPSWSPEQRLTASRLQMAQALRQSVGALLLQRVLGAIASPCLRAQKAASCGVCSSASGSCPARATQAQAAANSNAARTAAAQPPSAQEQKTPA